MAMDTPPQDVPPTVSIEEMQQLRLENQRMSKLVEAANTNITRLHANLKALVHRHALTRSEDAKAIASIRADLALETSTVKHDA